MTASKVLLVTGASRGIGAATALLAAREGYAVAVNYRHNRQAADDVVARVVQAGGQAVAIQADISLEADILRLFQTVDEVLGPLTALVNNAGILEKQARVDEINGDRLRRILNANVIGSFLCAREAVRRMSTRADSAGQGGAGGVIVNVSSRAAVLGSPGEYVDYAMSKGAIDTLTVGLAKEVALEGIRVCGVRPGLIETEIHASGGEAGRVARLAAGVPMGRGGTAQEVAQVIVWLLSGAASYVTGTTIDVSGGR